MKEPARCILSHRLVVVVARQNSPAPCSTRYTSLKTLSISCNTPYFAHNIVRLHIGVYIESGDGKPERGVLTWTLLGRRVPFPSTRKFEESPMGRFREFFFGLVRELHAKPGSGSSTPSLFYILPFYLQY